MLDGVELMIVTLNSDNLNYIVGENCESIKRNAAHDTDTLTCFEVTIKGVVNYVSLIDYSVEEVRSESHDHLLKRIRMDETV